MAGTIISGSHLTGIVLNNPGTENPATVAAGGYVTNTGTTNQGDAIYGAAGNAWTVTNLGTVASTATTAQAIALADGGIVTNGATDATTALITSVGSGIAIVGGSGTVSNFGTILRNAGGPTGAGAYLGNGGVVTNGSAADTSALIDSAQTGVSEKNAYGTVANFGTIESTATGSSGVGVYLNAGGVITNAAGGLITADRGAVVALTVAATLTNDGTISSTGTANPAVYFSTGGTITNGADTASALISGKAGGIVVKSGFGVVSNLGTVLVTAGATQGAAVYIGDGGIVTNGSTAATNALIESTLSGVVAKNEYGTVTNFATIEANGTSGAGVYLNGGGIITNAVGGVITAYNNAIHVVQGGTAQTSATLTNDGLIENTGSHAAVYFDTYASITNAGTIETTSTKSAINLRTVGTVTNTGLIAGAAGTAITIGGTAATQATITIDNDATITGDAGITISSLDTGFNTIVNDGTITGTDGTAVAFGSGDDVLVVDPNSVFNGAVGNFHVGDRIDFANQPETSYSYSNGVLTLVNATMNGTTQVSLTLSGSFGASQLVVGSDDNGGTDVTLNASATIFGPPQLAISAFGASTAGGGWTSQELYPRKLGDVTGNGLDDIVGFGNNGVYVSLANGDGTFAAPILASSNFGASASAGGWTSQSQYPRELGDVTGNGQDDIVAFGADGVYVALANTNGTFQAPFLASSNFGASASAGGWTDNDSYPRELGDVTGNGQDDIVAFGADGVYVSLANPNGTFQAPFLASSDFGASASAGGWSSQNLYPRFLADVTGNGRDDIVAFGANGVYVALANTNGTFQAPYLALAAFGASTSAGGWTSEEQYPRELADVNGDGIADIVGFGQNGVFVALGQSNGTFAAPTTDIQNFGFGASAGGWSSQSLYPRLLGDVTSGTAADIVGFGSNGVYVSPSLDSTSRTTQQLVAAMATFSSPAVTTTPSTTATTSDALQHTLLAASNS